MDIIQLDVPLFIRLLELAREEIKDDQDLHDIAEAVTALSKRGAVTMQQYPEILKYMKSVDQPDELHDIKRLSGVK